MTTNDTLQKIIKELNDYYDIQVKRNGYHWLGHKGLQDAIACVKSHIEKELK